MNLLHVGRYVRSAKVARWKKLLGVLAVVYAAFPLDAIPDALPVLGWLDDLGVLTAAFAFIARDLSKFVKQERRETAPPPARVLIDAEPHLR